MAHLLLLALAAAAPQPGELRTFRDWTVGCDNGRACHATSLMPEDGSRDTAPTINVKREPEAGAAPVIAVILEKGAAADLLVDGRPLVVRLAVTEEEFRVDARDTAAAVAALRSGRTLRVRDKAGQLLGTASLAGASAALRYIDDAQKRTGTVTALVRTGSRPASTIPTPPSLPVVRSASIPLARGPRRKAAHRGTTPGQRMRGGKPRLAWLRQRAGVTRCRPNLDPARLRRRRL